jgi:hypothetical protein
LTIISARGGEHVRVLERLVLAFGHRQDRDLRVLAEIPQRRAHQIADVLDEQHAVGLLAPRAALGRSVRVVRW